MKNPPIPRPHQDRGEQYGLPDVAHQVVDRGLGEARALLALADLHTRVGRPKRVDGLPCRLHYLDGVGLGGFEYLHRDRLAAVEAEP